jgi:hypothetical protein
VVTTKLNVGKYGANDILSAFLIHNKIDVTIGRRLEFRFAFFIKLNYFKTHLAELVRALHIQEYLISLPQMLSK